MRDIIEKIESQKNAVYILEEIKQSRILHSSSNCLVLIKLQLKYFIVGGIISLDPNGSCQCPA